MRTRSDNRSLGHIVTNRIDRNDGPAARVQRVDRGLVSLLVDGQPLRASLGADLLDRIAHDPVAAPCAGDWCTWRRWSDGPVTVEQVLARGPSIVRADVNGSSRGQVLAANIDVVIVVVALLPEPAMSRVERLLALAWASGARPLVVLTKADLVPDASLVAEDVAAVAPGVRVLVASGTTGDGLEDVRREVGQGTAALIGSSGSGKSTLVNGLLGAEVLTTRAIRDDGRGRHTSVRRELVLLPGGGVLIDTPGLRGAGLRDAMDGVAATFSDIEEIARGCRFDDCSHTAEKGCAVRTAVESGELRVRRIESWRKLRAEAQAMDRRRRRGNA